MQITFYSILFFSYSSISGYFSESPNWLAIWQPTPIPDTITLSDPAHLWSRFQDCVNPSGQTASISAWQAFWRSPIHRQQWQDERQMKKNWLRSWPKGLVLLNSWDFFHFASQPLSVLPSPHQSPCLVDCYVSHGTTSTTPEPQCPFIPNRKEKVIKDINKCHKNPRRSRWLHLEWLWIVPLPIQCICFFVFIGTTQKGPIQI